MTTATIPVLVTLRQDSSSGWLVEHDGEVLGLVYRIGRGREWKARPRGRPAPAVGHPTRAAAIVALLEATR